MVALNRRVKVAFTLAFLLGSCPRAMVANRLHGILMTPMASWLLPTITPDFAGGFPPCHLGKRVNLLILYVFSSP